MELSDVIADMEPVPRLEPWHVSFTVTASKAAAASAQANKYGKNIVELGFAKTFILVGYIVPEKKVYTVHCLPNNGGKWAGNYSQLLCNNNVDIK